MPLPGLPPVQYVQAAETRPVRGELTLVYLGAGASVREVLMQLPTFMRAPRCYAQLPPRLDSLQLRPSLFSMLDRPSGEATSSPP